MPIFRASFYLHKHKSFWLLLATLLGFLFVAADTNVYARDSSDSRDSSGSYNIAGQPGIHYSQWTQNWRDAANNLSSGAIEFNSERSLIHAWGDSARKEAWTAQEQIQADIYSAIMSDLTQGGDELGIYIDNFDLPLYIKTRGRDLIDSWQWRTVDYLENRLLSATEGSLGASPFVRNINIDYQTPLGNRRGHVGIDALGSLWEDKDSAWVWQLRGQVADQSAIGGSAGVIYRRIAGDNVLIGVNTFIDYEDTKDLGDFIRSSYGAEARSEWIDLYTNLYDVWSDTGNRLANGDIVYSQDGFDLEVAIHSPELRWLSGGLTYFWYNGLYGEEDDKGLRYNVRTDLLSIGGKDGLLGMGSRLELALEYENGSIGSQWGGRIIYNYNFGERNRSLGRSSAFNARDYFYEPARREYTHRLRRVKGEGAAAAPQMEVRSGSDVDDLTVEYFAAASTLTTANPTTVTVGGEELIKYTATLAASSTVKFDRTQTITVGTNTGQADIVADNNVYSIRLETTTTVAIEGDGSTFRVVTGTAAISRGQGDNVPLQIVTFEEGTITLIGTSLRIARLVTTAMHTQEHVAIRLDEGVISYTINDSDPGRASIIAEVRMVSATVIVMIDEDGDAETPPMTLMAANCDRPSGRYPEGGVVSSADCVGDVNLLPLDSNVLAELVSGGETVSLSRPDDNGDSAISATITGLQATTWTDSYPFAPDGGRLSVSGGAARISVSDSPLLTLQSGAEASFLRSGDRVAVLVVTGEAAIGGESISCPPGEADVAPDSMAFGNIDIYCAGLRVLFEAGDDVSGGDGSKGDPYRAHRNAGGSFVRVSASEGSGDYRYSIVGDSAFVINGGSDVIRYRDGVAAAGIHTLTVQVSDINAGDDAARIPRNRALYITVAAALGFAEHNINLVAAAGVTAVLADLSVRFQPTGGVSPITYNILGANPSSAAGNFGIIGNTLAITEAFLDPTTITVLIEAVDAGEDDSVTLSVIAQVLDRLVFISPQRVRVSSVDSNINLLTLDDFALNAKGGVAYVLASTAPARITNNIAITGEGVLRVNAAIGTVTIITAFVSGTDDDGPATLEVIIISEMLNVDLPIIEGAAGVARDGSVANPYILPMNTRVGDALITVSGRGGGGSPDYSYSDSDSAINIDADSGIITFVTRPSDGQVQQAAFIVANETAGGNEERLTITLYYKRAFNDEAHEARMFMINGLASGSNKQLYYINVETASVTVVNPHLTTSWNLPVAESERDAESLGYLNGTLYMILEGAGTDADNYHSIDMNTGVATDLGAIALNGGWRNSNTAGGMAVYNNMLHVYTQQEASYIINEDHSFERRGARDGVRDTNYSGPSTGYTSIRDKFFLFISNGQQLYRLNQNAVSEEVYSGVLAAGLIVEAMEAIGIELFMSASDNRLYKVDSGTGEVITDIGKHDIDGVSGLACANCPVGVDRLTVSQTSGANIASGTGSSASPYIPAVAVVGGVIVNHDAAGGPGVIANIVVSGGAPPYTYSVDNSLFMVSDDGELQFLNGNVPPPGNYTLTIIVSENSGTAFSERVSIRVRIPAFEAALSPATGGAFVGGGATALDPLVFDRNVASDFVIANIAASGGGGTYSYGTDANVIVDSSGDMRFKASANALLIGAQVQRALVTVSDGTADNKVTLSVYYKRAFSAANPHLIAIDNGTNDGALRSVPRQGALSGSKTSAVLNPFITSYGLSGITITNASALTFTKETLYMRRQQSDFLYLLNPDSGAIVNSISINIGSSEDAATIAGMAVIGDMLYFGQLNHNSDADSSTTPPTPKNIYRRLLSYDLNDSNTDNIGFVINFGNSGLPAPRGTPATYMTPTGMAAIGDVLYISSTNPDRLFRVPLSPLAIEIIGPNFYASSSQVLRNPSGLAAFGSMLYMIDRGLAEESDAATDRLFRVSTTGTTVTAGVATAVSSTPLGIVNSGGLACVYCPLATDPAAQIRFDEPTAVSVSLTVTSLQINDDEFVSVAIVPKVIIDGGALQDSAVAYSVQSVGTLNLNNARLIVGGDVRRLEIRAGLARESPGVTAVIVARREGVAPTFSVILDFKRQLAFSPALVTVSVSPINIENKIANLPEISEESLTYSVASVNPPSIANNFFTIDTSAEGEPRIQAGQLNTDDTLGEELNNGNLQRQPTTVTVIINAEDSGTSSSAIATQFTLIMVEEARLGEYRFEQSIITATVTTETTGAITTVITRETTATGDTSLGYRLASTDPSGVTNLGVTEITDDGQRGRLNIIAPFTSAQTVTAVISSMDPDSSQATISVVVVVDAAPLRQISFTPSDVTFNLEVGGEMDLPSIGSESLTYTVISADPPAVTDFIEVDTVANPNRINITATALAASLDRSQRQPTTVTLIIGATAEGTSTARLTAVLIEAARFGEYRFEPNIITATVTVGTVVEITTVMPQDATGGSSDSLTYELVSADPPGAMANFGVTKVNRQGRLAIATAFTSAQTVTAVIGSMDPDGSQATISVVVVVDAAAVVTELAVMVAAGAELERGSGAVNDPYILPNSAGDGFILGTAIASGGDSNYVYSVSDGETTTMAINANGALSLPSSLVEPSGGGQDDPGYLLTRQVQRAIIAVVSDGETVLLTLYYNRDLGGTGVFEVDDESLYFADTSNFFPPNLIEVNPYLDNFGVSDNFGAPSGLDGVGTTLYMSTRGANAAIYRIDYNTGVAQEVVSNARLSAANLSNIGGIASLGNTGIYMVDDVANGLFRVDVSRNDSPITEVSFSGEDFPDDGTINGLGSKGNAFGLGELYFVSSENTEHKLYKLSSSGELSVAQTHSSYADVSGVGLNDFDDLSFIKSNGPEIYIGDESLSSAEYELLPPPSLPVGIACFGCDVDRIVFRAQFNVGEGVFGSGAAADPIIIANDVAAGFVLGTIVGSNGSLPYANVRLPDTANDFLSSDYNEGEFEIKFSAQPIDKVVLRQIFIIRDSVNTKRINITVHYKRAFDTETPLLFSADQDDAAPSRLIAIDTDRRVGGEVNADFGTGVRINPYINSEHFGGDNFVGMAGMGGTLYMASESSGGGDTNLYTVNVNTGVALLVGAMGVDVDSGGLAALGSDLYLVGNGGQLYRVAANGQATAVGSAGFGRDLTSPIDLATIGGTLYMVDSSTATGSRRDSLYVIDPIAGTAGEGVFVNGGGSNPNAIEVLGLAAIESTLYNVSAPNFLDTLDVETGVGSRSGINIGLRGDGGGITSDHTGVGVLTGIEAGDLACVYCSVAPPIIDGSPRQISFTPSDVVFNLEVGGEVDLPSIGSESLTYTVISADPPAVTDFIEVDTVANPNKINITATALAASLDRSQRQPTTVTLIIGATAEGASTARLTAILIEAARFGEYRFEPNIITATVTVGTVVEIATVMSEDATGEIPDSLTYRLVSTDPSDVAANFSVTKVNRQGRLDIVTAFTSAQTVTAVIGSMDPDGSQATISVVVVVDPAPPIPIDFTFTFNLEVGGGDINLPSSLQQLIAGLGDIPLTYTVISADPPVATDFIEVASGASGKINITTTDLAANLGRSQRQPTTVTLIVDATVPGIAMRRIEAILIEEAQFGEYRFEPNIITATVNVDATGAIATVMPEDATGEIPDSLTYELVSADPPGAMANFGVTKVNRQGRLAIATAFTSAQTVTAVISSMDPDGSQATISVVVVVDAAPPIPIDFTFTFNLEVGGGDIDLPQNLQILIAGFGGRPLTYTVISADPPVATDFIEVASGASGKINITTTDLAANLGRSPRQPTTVTLIVDATVPGEPTTRIMAILIEEAQLGEYRFEPNIITATVTVGTVVEITTVMPQDATGGSSDSLTYELVSADPPGAMANFSVTKVNRQGRLAITAAFTSAQTVTAVISSTDPDGSQATISVVVVVIPLPDLDLNFDIVVADDVVGDGSAAEPYVFPSGSGNGYVLATMSVNDAITDEQWIFGSTDDGLRIGSDGIISFNAEPIQDQVQRAIITVAVGGTNAMTMSLHFKRAFDEDSEYLLGIAGKTNDEDTSSDAEGVLLISPDSSSVAGGLVNPYLSGAEAFRDITGIEAMAAIGSRLYIARSGANILYVSDINSGAIRSTITNADINEIQGMTSLNGALYAVKYSSNKLFSVNPETGAATAGINILNTNTTAKGLAAIGDDLYLLREAGGINNGSEILRFKPNSAAGTLVFSFPNNIGVTGLGAFNGSLYVSRGRGESARDEFRTSAEVAVRSNIYRIDLNGGNSNGGNLGNLIDLGSVGNNKIKGLTCINCDAGSSGGITPPRPISFTPSDVTFNLEVGGEVNLPSIGSESLTYTVISADPPAVTDFIEVDTVANPNRINITATALAASLDRSQRQPTTVTLIIGATAEGASTARLTAILIEAARFGEYRFEPNIITATVTVGTVVEITTVMPQDATGGSSDSLTYELVSADPPGALGNFGVTEVNRQGRLAIATAFTSAQTVTAVIGSTDPDGSQATISVVVVVDPAPLRQISFTPSDVTFNLGVGGSVDLPSIGSESLTYTVISADPPAVTDFIEVDTVANPNKINITATALAASLDRSQRQPTTVTLIIGATAEGTSTARLTAILIEEARFGEYRFEPNIITATVTVGTVVEITTVMSEDATGGSSDSLTYELVSADPSGVAANFSVTEVNRQGRLDIVTAFTSPQTVTVVIGSTDPDSSQATISVVVVVNAAPPRPISFTFTFNLEVGGGDINLPSSLLPFIALGPIEYTVISADPPAATDFIEVDSATDPRKINITTTDLAANLGRSQRQPTTVTLIVDATVPGIGMRRIEAILIEEAQFGEYRFEPNIITATVNVDVTGAIATVITRDATGESSIPLTYILVSANPPDVAANFGVTEVNRQGRLDIVAAFISPQIVTAVIGSTDPDGSQATISVVVVALPLPDLSFEIIAAADVVGDGSAAEPYVFPSGSGNGYVLATMSVNDAITDEQWIFGSTDSGLQIGSDGIISFNAEPIQDQVQRAIITVAVGGTNAMTMSLHFKRAFDDSTRIFMADGGNGNSGNKLSWLPHDAAAAAASQGGQNSLGVAVRVNPYLSRYGLSGSPDVDAQALAFNNNILYMFGGGDGANDSQLHVINHNTGRITKTFSDRIFGYGSGLTSLDGALYATDFNGGGGLDDELFRIEINGDAVTRTKIGASFNRNPHAITTIENRLYILLRGDSGLYEVTIDGSPIGFLDRFGDGSRIKRIDTNPDTNLNNVSGLVAVQTTLYFLDAELKALWRFEEGSLNARPVRVGGNNLNTGGSAAIEEPSGLACFNCPEVTPIVITDTAGAGVTKDDQTYENVPYDLNAVIVSLSATGGNGEPYVFSVVSEGDLFRLENNQLMLAPNANNSRPMAAANNTYIITLMVMGEGALDRSVIRNVVLGGPLPMGVGSAADPFIIELLDSELTAYIMRDFGETGYTTSDPLLRVNGRHLQFETSLESNDAQQATIENQVQRVVVNDPDGAEIMIYYKRVYNFETPRMFFVNDDASDDALYWVPHNNDSATATGIGTADIGKALRVNPYITNMNSADALSPEGLTYHTATLYMAEGGGAAGTAARSTLYAVNINNGVVSDAIVTANINIAKGLASFGGQLYAIDNPVNADGDNLVGDKLYTLNTATGAVNQRGPNLENGNYAGLAAFGNRLFALDNMAGGNASLDELAQINPGSGVEYRENLRQGNDFDNPEALAALGSDLYLIGGNVLYRINRDSSLDNNPDAALVRAGGPTNNLGNGISNVKGMACVYCAAVSRVPLVISDVAMGATTGSGSLADSYVAHVDRTDVLIKFTASGGGNAYSYRVTGSEFEIDDSGNIEFLDDFSPANNLYTVTVMALANNASAFPTQKVIYINTFGFSAIGYDTVAAADVVGDGSVADPYVFPSDSGNGYVLATLIVLDTIADEQWTFDSTDSALQIGVSDGVISFDAEPIQDEVQQAIITVAANGEIAMTATLYFKRAFDNAVRLFMVDRISGDSGRLYWVPHNAAAEAASRGGKRGQATRVNRYLDNFGDEVKNPEAITFHDNTLYILAGGDVGNSELHAINHNTGVVISTLQTDLDNGLAMTSLNGALYAVDTTLTSSFNFDDELSRLDINGERVTRTAAITVSRNPVGLAAVDNDKLYILGRGDLSGNGGHNSRIFRLILDGTPTVDDFLGGPVRRNDNSDVINILSGLVEIANTLYFSSETIPGLLRSHVETADLSGSLRGDILRSVAGGGNINGGNGGGTTVGEIKGLACYCNEDV